MSSPLLAGKTLVVIGGTTGLGLSAARAFVEAGARVVVVGRSAESGEKARAELGGESRARVLAGDAVDSATAPRAIDAAVAAFGGFDGLYHAAGGSGRRMGDGPLHELTDEGWQAAVDLNLRSLVFSNRAAVRAFLARGAGGSVLNMGSVLGSSPRRATSPRTPGRRHRRMLAARAHGRAVCHDARTAGGGERGRWRSGSGVDEIRAGAGVRGGVAGEHFRPGSGDAGRGRGAGGRGVVRAAGGGAGRGGVAARRRGGAGAGGGTGRMGRERGGRAARNDEWRRGRAEDQPIL